MGSSKCATTSSTKCAGTSLLHTILRRQRLQRVITAIVGHLVENVPRGRRPRRPGIAAARAGLARLRCAVILPAKTHRRSSPSGSEGSDPGTPARRHDALHPAPARIDELAPPPFVLQTFRTSKAKKLEFLADAFL